MQLSKSLKAFCSLFTAFLKCRSNFEHIEKKKMTLIAYVFPKLYNNVFTTW